MVATNDDIVAAINANTEQLKRIKRLIKGTYAEAAQADSIETGV